MIRINRKVATTLAAVLIPLGIYAGYAYRDFSEKALLAEIDDAVSLGNRLGNAVGNYQIKAGKPPAALADLPERFADTPTTRLALTPGGEVIVALGNQGNSAIAGKRLYFRPVIINGMVISVTCRTDADAAFRQLTEDRCD